MGSRNRFQNRLVQSLSVAVMLLAAYPLMAATNVKLSGTIPAGGDVTLFKISPDGRYAVFLADARIDGIPELFSTHIIGGSRNPLTPSLSAGTAVLGFAISPDSQRVVYWTGPDIGPATGVYAVSINGGERVDLFGAVDPGAEVKDVVITPDSQQVIYLSKKIPDPPGEPSEQHLWAVTISGGSPVKIFGPVCELCSIKFKAIPDGSGLVYLINYKSAEPELHAATFAGMDVLLATRSADFFITPDSERVVFWEYYAGKVLSSVPITGGAAEVLVGIHYTATFKEIKISPDSKYVVYLSDQLVDERMELFSVPVDGSEPTGCIKNRAKSPKD